MSSFSSSSLSSIPSIVVVEIETQTWFNDKTMTATTFYFFFKLSIHFFPQTSFFAPPFHVAKFNRLIASQCCISHLILSKFNSIVSFTLLFDDVKSNEITWKCSFICAVMRAVKISSIVRNLSYGKMPSYNAAFEWKTKENKQKIKQHNFRDRNIYILGSSLMT